jgi:hypothetical protein
VDGVGMEIFVFDGDVGSFKANNDAESFGLDGDEDCLTYMYEGASSS